MKKNLIALKLFCRTLGVIIPYIFLLLGVNGVLFQISRAFAEAAKDPEQLSDAMYFFGDINVVCFFLYFIFLFISYEYMRKVRGAQMEEVLSSYGMAGMSIYIRQYLVLVLSVVLVSINILVYMIWGWKNLSCADELFGEVLRLFFVNVLFLSLGAASMGTILAKIKNRFVGYAVIVGILFLVLPNAVTFYVSLQLEYHIPVFFIRDLIYLIPPDITAAPDPLYAFGLEAYRMAATGLWIVCAVMVLAWKVLKQKERIRKAVTIGLCLLAVLCVYGTESKGSVLLQWQHPESAEEIWNYYGDDGGKSEQANFAVSKYELDVKLGKELEAEVWMTLDATETLDQYPFTLNHAYRVEEVTNQDGTSLDYSRDGDYLCIRPGNQPVSKLFISYQGHSTLFYANKKACFLPGFFSYYPKAGYQAAFEYDDMTNGLSYHAEPKTMFEVKTNKSGMISNLSKTDSGFYGEAETLTLIDGYYRVSQEGDCQMLSYPLIESENGRDKMVLTWFQEEWEEWEQLKDYLGIDGEEFRYHLPETVFMVPSSLVFNSLLRGIYRYEDCAFICGSNVTPYHMLEDVLRQRVPEEKKLLSDIFIRYQLNGDFDPEFLFWYRDAIEYENEMQEMWDVCADKIKELGAQSFARQVMQYLLDENNHMEPFAFINSMGKEE